MGLERAGMQTVGFCEIDPFCRKVLRKHWPDVPIHDDIKTLRGDEFGPVDVICGGFPCQDLSCAGVQKGFEGERSSLYREMLRIVSFCGPKYAIFENVAALLTGDNGRWFAQFLYDLAEIGYDAEWHCIPASAIGAPHERDRVWIISYATSIRQSESALHLYKFKKYKENTRTWNGRGVAQSGIFRVVNGIPDQMDRLKALGNAVVPQIPEIIGRAIIEVESKK